MNFTTIVLFLSLVTSFLGIFPVPCALSIKLSSLIPNFSFAKSFIILSLSSHVSLLSSWNPSKQKLFRRLYSSKSASFFLVFVTRSSVISSSLFSSTLLSMPSSFLLTSSTLSLWSWTLYHKSANSFLIFELSSFKISFFLSSLSIVLLNTFNNVFSCICSKSFTWLNEKFQIRNTVWRNLFKSWCKIN